MKTQPTDGRKDLLSHLSGKGQIILFLNGLITRDIGIFPKKIYKQPTSILKMLQHYQPSGEKRKSESR